MVMTAAAAVVSPGGLGDAARVRAWRKEMCWAVSAEMAARRAWESMMCVMWRDLVYVECEGELWSVI